MTEIASEAAIGAGSGVRDLMPMVARKWALISGNSKYCCVGVCKRVCNYVTACMIGDSSMCVCVCICVCTEVGRNFFS